MCSSDLDLLVALAKNIDEAGGVIGSRMTGGGFGGSVLVLVRTEQVGEVRTAVAERFGRAGWAAPRFGAAVPSAGARRIR